MLQMLLQGNSPGLAAAALARLSQARSSQGGETGGMRRSVGMRDSMCLFLQLEGAVEGENGFEAEEVLQVCVCACVCVCVCVFSSDVLACKQAQG